MYKCCEYQYTTFSRTLRIKACVIYLITLDQNFNNMNRDEIKSPTLVCMSPCCFYVEHDVK